MVWSCLPQEIPDHIVDLLHDEPKTLKACCPVSTKSWAPRARKHLFAEVAFRSLDALKAWKKTFLDLGPVNSPACYIHSLLITYPQIIPAIVAGENGWIEILSNVEHLTMQGTSDLHFCSLLQLTGP